MGRVLAILEVSRKQDYIFSGKDLKGNVRRSAEIAYVTGNKFFEDNCKEFYKKEENMVYAGGGHVVLQFNSRESARALVRAATERAQRMFDGMELFAKIMPYEEDKKLSENLNALIAGLEKKKAERIGSIRRVGFGIEKIDSVSKAPLGEVISEKLKAPQAEDLISPPRGKEFAQSFERICRAYGEEKGENFIAIVHVDGNNMGKRVEGLYKEIDKINDWDKQCESLRKFSEGIQKNFEETFSEVAEVVAEKYKRRELPIRPVVLAGDDVCFITRGDIGIECGRVFLEKLSQKRNPVDGQLYTACAGVALVHLKYPFYEAYNLSEELCSSAKKFGAEYDSSGNICAMDWHIEFGQMKDTLISQRADYTTDDGCQLELRPVAVVNTGKVPKQRTYQSVVNCIRRIEEQGGSMARSKIKELRNALKQGEIEAAFYTKMTSIRRPLSDCIPRVYNEKYTGRRMREHERMLDELPLFQKVADGDKKITKRCVIFDAMEIMDHFVRLGGKGGENK